MNDVLAPADYGAYFKLITQRTFDRELGISDLSQKPVQRSLIIVLTARMQTGGVTSFANELNYRKQVFSGLRFVTSDIGRNVNVASNLLRSAYGSIDNNTLVINQ